MNPYLQKIADTVDAVVDSEEAKDQYARILMAGKRIMFDEKTHKDISWLQEGADPVAIVNGVVDLIAIIGELSEGTMQPEPALGAAITLTMEALDFAERANGLEITEEIANTAALAIDERMKEGMKQPSTEQPPAPAEQPPPAAPQGLINAGSQL